MTIKKIILSGVVAGALLFGLCGRGHAFQAKVGAGSSSGGGGAASSITSGTTTITSGADKSVCFDDGGKINCADAGFQYTKSTGTANATAGVFTTLSSGDGTTTSAAFGSALNLTAPPAIGGTTPAAGTFTTLNATSAPALGALGGTTSSTGQFTKVCSGTSACTLPATTGGYRGLGIGLNMDWDGSNDHPLFIEAGSGGGVNWHLDTSGYNHLQFRDSNSLQIFTIGAGGLVAIGTDNDVSTMSRLPLHFDEGKEAALVANESMGTFKTVKAITIENIELDIKISPTCSVSEQITCFDCGATAGACTASQTSTIMNAVTIASGATRQSIDETVNTANVAAGEYVSCLITAGTCTVSDNAITMMARPQ